MQNLKINKKTGNVKIGTLCIEPTLKFNAELLLTALNKKDKVIAVGVYDNLVDVDQPTHKYLFFNDWRFFIEIIYKVLNVLRAQTKHNTTSTDLSNERIKEIEKEVTQQLNSFVNDKCWEKELRKGESFPNKIA